MVDLGVLGTLTGGGQNPLGTIVGSLKCGCMYGTCVLADLNCQIDERGQGGDGRDEFADASEILDRHFRHLE